MAEAVTGMTCGVERRPVYGRAEPAPPRGGQSQVTGLAGEKPDMTRKAIFSEGRTLCARMARPYADRGISLVGGGLANGRGRNGDDVWGGTPPRLRACRARPSERWPRAAQMA